jgi:superfamily II DNA or RNA helicase
VSIIVSSVLFVKGLSKQLRSRVIQDLSLPNPEYVSRERRGLWTGNVAASICLVKTYRLGGGDGDVVHQLPRGYLETLILRIKETGDVPIPRDRRLTLPPIDEDFHGELFPYQQSALEAMTRYGSGVLVAPCGSGKTALGCALIAHRKQPSLILVHTKDLLKQTCDAVRRWLEVEPGVIGDGKLDIRPITVGMTQTLNRRPEILDDVKGRFGLVLQDEAHHTPATSFTETIQQFPATFRYGLSATPTRRDGLWPFTEAVIGPIRHRVMTTELLQAGRSVIPEIRWVRSDFFSFAEEWVDLVSELTTDEARNQLIVNVILRALDDGRRIIALSERVAHVRLLAERLNRLRPGAVVLATGQSGKKEREAALRKIAAGEARVLLSTKLADEGLDLPELDCLVLLTPARDGARTTQRVGRILRSLSGKRQPVVFDLVDSRVKMLASQARSRFFDCYRSIAPGQILPEWLGRRRVGEA